ncbi:MAG TPA: VWA domain-containing protein [Bryobacteraceae bacterium]|jgi:VWFA-related protein|nr:VWA domain-containing protein [Bryobacteraceae bacterium]
MRKIGATFLAFTLAAGAQQVGQNAQVPAGGTPTFQASAQLVVETVSVKDKNGKPVEGLTAKDFTVTEDGMPQTIKLFEYQKLPEPVQVPASVDTLPLKAIALPKLPTSQIEPEKPGDIRYRDRRLLAIYFDLSAMPIADQLRSFDAARKFIATQMTPADLVALLMYQGGAVRVLQDFTADRDRLESIIETMSVGEDQDADTSTDADTGAAFGQDDSEFNIFNTDRQLSALQTAARMLGQLNEKKALLYFASGLKLNGVDNQAQLHATINAAIRAGVSFWPIDARGLVAMAPLGDASRGSPGGLAMYNGGTAGSMMAGFQQSQDTLWSLAADTGGKALLDFNDLTKGIVQAQQAFSSYYLIGYYTSNAALDGKFRRIKITLGGDLSAKLDFREGYFAGKQFGKFSTAEKERQLEDALMLGDPVTELTIAMELDYFQLNRAEYFVPMIVKIPGSELVLAKKGGAEHTLLDFIGEVKDDFGTTISNVRDKYDIKLSDATVAELATKPIEYDTGFTLLPGKYKVKFLARDAETGRIGTYEMHIVIPNLNKEDKRVPISSVVLSSQRVDAKDALANAAKDKGVAESVNPLVQEGQKLIPSVTRVFRKNRDLYIYLQAYQQGAAATQPLVAFVTFYRGQTKAFETAPLQVAEGLNNRLRTVPLKFSLPLNKLPNGEYNCQVTVLDPTSQKAAFWQAPIMIVP